MLRKSIVLAAFLVLVAAPAFAQVQGEVNFMVGYTFSDGVSFANATPINGFVYTRADPKDSVSFGIGAGVYLNHEAEIEFRYDHQPTTLEVTGNGAPTLSATMSVDNYHGNFVFNALDADAKVRPYIYIGLGATNYGSAAFATKTVTGMTKFSWDFGAGIKAYPSPHAGIIAGIRWVPTYIKTDAAGWWCDPYWGCAPAGNVQYSNQFELAGGVTFKFGG